jgi:hypothetical protein
MYGQKVGIPDRCDNGEGSYLFQHEPTSDLSLAPSSTVVSFDDITIYRIGGGKGSFIIHFRSMARSVPSLVFLPRPANVVRRVFVIIITIYSFIYSLLPRDETIR